MEEKLLQAIKTVFVIWNSKDRELEEKVKEYDDAISVIAEVDLKLLAYVFRDLPEDPDFETDWENEDYSDYLKLL